MKDTQRAFLRELENIVGKALVVEQEFHKAPRLEGRTTLPSGSVCVCDVWLPQTSGLRGVYALVHAGGAFEHDRTFNAWHPCKDDDWTTIRNLAHRKYGCDLEEINEVLVWGHKRRYRL